jgi:hypothetical protein
MLWVIEKLFGFPRGGQKDRQRRPGSRSKALERPRDNARRQGWQSGREPLNAAVIQSQDAEVGYLDRR